MASANQRPERRAEALSKARIVDAAIDILDAHGAGALTFRTLGARLATGSGAIYWHVADKEALLAAATDQVIAQALAQEQARPSPREALRALAEVVFDAVDARPWVGAQLSGDPWQPAVLRILESIGAQVTALGVPEPARFNAATALFSLILGLAGQYAVAVRHFPRDMNRSAFLRTMAARWLQLDPAQYPFVRQAAAHLPEHDDREQFLAGIDLILAGIAASHGQTSPLAGG